MATTQENHDRLIKAIRDRDRAGINAALKAGAPARGINDDGEPMLEAAKQEYIDFAVQLMVAGADIRQAMSLLNLKLEPFFDHSVKRSEQDWQPYRDYSKASDWLRRNESLIATLSVPQILRQLTEKISGIDQRLAAVEETVSKIVTPPPLEKSKLNAPKTNITP